MMPIGGGGRSTSSRARRLLIDRADIEAFGEAVEALGEAWSGRIRFRLRGPLAPYDFVASEAVETGV